MYVDGLQGTRRMLQHVRVGLHVFGTQYMVMWGAVRLLELVPRECTQVAWTAIV